MTLFLISLAPYILFTIFKTKKSFHMLQQNFYDDDCRYFKWILANIQKIAYESDLLLIRNIGKSSVKEIRNKLKEFNIIVG